MVCTATTPCPVYSFPRVIDPLEVFTLPCNAATPSPLVLSLHPPYVAMPCAGPPHRQQLGAEALMGVGWCQY